MRFIGLSQDAQLTELERREVNRYVIACREAVKATEPQIRAHWHYLAHIRFKTLQRIRHSI